MSGGAAAGGSCVAFYARQTAALDGGRALRGSDSCMPFLMMRRAARAPTLPVLTIARLLPAPRRSPRCASSMSPCPKWQAMRPRRSNFSTVSCRPRRLRPSAAGSFGFVIGAALPGTLAANWLAGAWDQNAGLYRTTPGVAHLEVVALRWLVDLLELPAGTGGAFVTGATVANFTALAAARHEVLARVGWNVEADGLFGAPPITVMTRRGGASDAAQIARHARPGTRADRARAR